MPDHAKDSPSQRPGLLWSWWWRMRGPRARRQAFHQALLQAGMDTHVWPGMMNRMRAWQDMGLWQRDGRDGAAQKEDMIALVHSGASIMHKPDGVVPQRQEMWQLIMQGLRDSSCDASAAALVEILLAHQGGDVRAIAAQVLVQGGDGPESLRARLLDLIDDIKVPTRSRAAVDWLGMVEQLLKAGAEPMPALSRCDLMEIAIVDADQSLVDILTAHGYEVDERSFRIVMNGPFRGNRIQWLSYLRDEAGMNVAVPDEHGATNLEWAVYHQCDEVIHWMLDEGYRFNASARIEADRRKILGYGSPDQPVLIHVFRALMANYPPHHPVTQRVMAHLPEEPWNLDDQLPAFAVAPFGQHEEEWKAFFKAMEEKRILTDGCAEPVAGKSRTRLRL